MKVVRTVRFTAAVAACSVLLLSTTGVFLRAAPEPGFQPKYAKLPLSFEENRGQAPTGVRYLSRTRGGVLLLRPDSFSLEADGGRTISMRFVGSSGPKAPTGEEKLLGTTSYFIAATVKSTRRACPAAADGNSMPTMTAADGALSSGAGIHDPHGQSPGLNRTPQQRVDRCHGGNGFRRLGRQIDR